METEAQRCSVISPDQQPVRSRTRTQGPWLQPQYSPWDSSFPFSFPHGFPGSREVSWGTALRVVLGARGQKPGSLFPKRNRSSLIPPPSTTTSSVLSQSPAHICYHFPGPHCPLLPPTGEKKILAWLLQGSEACRHSVCGIALLCSDGPALPRGYPCPP